MSRRYEKGKRWMAESELHVHGNMFFTSDKMHVSFATTLFFEMETFFCIHRILSPFQGKSDDILILIFYNITWKSREDITRYCVFYKYYKFYKIKLKVSFKLIRFRLCCPNTSFRTVMGGFDVYEKGISL